MAWYRAESNKAEMSGSEDAMKSLNSETSCWGGRETSLSMQSFAAVHVDHLRPKAVWHRSKQINDSLRIYLQFRVI